MSDNKREQDAYHAEDGHGSNSENKIGYKLLIDPQIRKGEEKLFRYDGETYNTENHGQGVVILRDPRPRMNRLWSRREKADLPIPRYKVDEWYIGAVPPREVTFSKLNDNITKQFMEKLCLKFGKLERVRVYHHPKTQKHMGLSKIVFTSMKAAGECVKQLHMTSIMGNVIHAQIDSKGELLNKLFQRIARGEMVAETIPDVIRHTQDGISMSNKYKERCHHPKKEGRRVSNDDPRKLRHSRDEQEKTGVHPKALHDNKKRTECRGSQSRHREGQATDSETRNESASPSDKKKPPVKREFSSDLDDSHSELDNQQPPDLESRISSLLQRNMLGKDDSKPLHSRDSTSDSDSKLAVKRRGKKYSQDSRDSAEDSSHMEGNDAAAKMQQDDPVPRPFHNAEHRKLFQTNSSPAHDMPTHVIDRSPDFEHSNNKHPRPDGTYHADEFATHHQRPERTPPYHYPPHHRRDLNRHHDLDFYPSGHPRDFNNRDRKPGGFRERGDISRGYPLHERNIHRSASEFDFRRRDGPHPRRPHSPREHWPNSDHHPRSELFSGHHMPRGHYRSPSPPRFSRSHYSPPRDRREGSRRRSPTPERFRRTSRELRNDGAPRRWEHRSRSRSFTPERSREESEQRPALRKSQSRESPKLTLDQRLKEMTGESVGNAGHCKKKKSEQQGDQIPDDGSAVDMEISEGESEGEDMKRSFKGMDEKNVNRNDMPAQVPFPSREQWNVEDTPWNGLRPIQPGPIGHPMWNNVHDRDHPNAVPGQFQAPFHPDARWPGQFHSAAPPGMIPPPFNFGDAFHPGFHMVAPMRTQDFPLQYGGDERLCGCVLDNVVQDLKAIVGRDLNRKVVESMAFKVYEAWWDENASANAVARAVGPMSKMDKSSDKTVASDVTGDSKQKNLVSLNSFDPLNWAKNSFEMDGFRIGLGLRSALSKMPSFRVKKRPRTPTPPRDDENGDVVRSKRARRESKEEKARSTKEKNYRRIAALDSEGEDENEQSEESEVDLPSVQDKKSKADVLKIDEVFSDSESESEDEPSSESEISSSDEEESSEMGDESVGSDAETQKAKEEAKSTVAPAVSDADLSADVATLAKDRTASEDEQRNKEEYAEITAPINAAEPRSSTDSDFLPAVGEDPNIAASLLSPTALGVTASSITPQQLRHVHPKKRHRLLSRDQYEPFAKQQATDKKDELSMISEKERDVLETLADMHRMTDRRLSADSDVSTASGVSQKELKSVTDAETDPRKEAENISSTQKTLDTVEAISPVKKSLQTGSDISRVPPSPVRYKKKATLRESAQMAALAEEHNYFTPSFGPAHPCPSLNPIVAQIFEEHNYSQPILESTALRTDLLNDSNIPPSPSTLSATESMYHFKDEASDVISPAELVKLRHVKPKKNAAAQKKLRRRGEVSKVKFLPRSKMEEFIVAYEMWCSGLDLEDMMYLRNVYNTYLEDSNSPGWTHDSHWVPHAITAIPTPSAKPKRTSRTRDKSRTEETQGHHPTGCARTEGYYKLEDMIKLRQRREMYGRGQSHNDLDVADHAPKKNPSEVSSGTTQGALDKNLGSRETRHFMRRIAADIGSDAGDLFKYNQLMFRKKAVKFKKSSIHGWGLFAEEPIAADEMVIEYVGQVVRTLIAERREVHYTELGIGSSYLFRIDSDHIIDATKCGNYARFMNHSCNPSCYAKVITLDNAKKIVIYSKGPIKKSQEITYDYKFPLEDNKVVCFCGAESCRRTLN